MGSSEFIEKSVTEQVLDELFARIEKMDEFDETVIQKLKELVSSGGFSKASRITEVIKLMPEV